MDPCPTYLHPGHLHNTPFFCCFSLSRPIFTPHMYPTKARGWRLKAPSLTLRGALHTPLTTNGMSNPPKNIPKAGPTPPPWHRLRRMVLQYPPAALSPNLGVTLFLVFLSSHNWSQDSTSSGGKSTVTHNILALTFTHQ